MPEITSILENRNNVTRPVGDQTRLRGLSFSETLRKATADGNLKAAEQAAGDLVATTFIKPMLAQMRDDPLRSELFHGGSGEDMFAEHLETELAQRISERLSLTLTDAITRGITGQPARIQAQSPVGAAERIDTLG